MSETTDPQGRSAAEIEADVERTRARVTETIDALRGSISPGQMMDQIVDYARGSGGADFMRNLGNAVRDNPLPVLLIGSGIGWLLMSGQKKRGFESAPGSYVALPPPRPSSGGVGVMDRASGAAKDLGSAASGAAGSVGDALRGAAASVADAAGSVASSASSGTSTIGSGLSSAAGTARAYRHDAADAASAGLYAAGQGMRQTGSQLQEGWTRLSHEQPLLLGALGLAAGAALAALLPRTQTEDRLMGAASDAVMGQAGSMAREQYESIKESAAPHVQAARDALTEAPQAAQQKMNADGVSAATARDTATDVAGQLTGAVSGAAHDVAESTKSNLGKMDPDTRSST